MEFRSYGQTSVATRSQPVQKQQTGAATWRQRTAGIVPPVRYPPFGSPPPVRQQALQGGHHHEEHPRALPGQDRTPRGRSGADSLPRCGPEEDSDRGRAENPHLRRETDPGAGGSSLSVPVADRSSRVSQSGRRGAQTVPGARSQPVSGVH